MATNKLKKSVHMLIFSEYKHQSHTIPSAISDLSGLIAHVDAFNVSA